MIINRSEKTVEELIQWLLRFEDYSKRDEFQYREGHIYSNELMMFLGNNCLCDYPFEKSVYHFFTIIALKDKTVILKGSQSFNSYNGLIIDSLRIPNKGDQSLLQGLLDGWKNELARIELGWEKEQKTITNGKEGNRLRQFLNKGKKKQYEKRLNCLKSKIAFVELAIKESSDEVIENYLEGGKLSLYFSKEDKENEKISDLKHELHMLWQRRTIGDLTSKRYSLKDEICPACLGKHIVLENEIGLINHHFYAERECHFCWGEGNPFDKYTSMTTEEFISCIEKLFKEKRASHYRIGETVISRRTRTKVNYITFHSRYDMMPNVSEIYNMIFYIIKVKELTSNQTNVSDKLYADMLNEIREPYNRILFVTTVFPLFNKGFFGLPEIDEGVYPLEVLLERYKEMEKINLVLDKSYDFISSFRKRSRDTKQHIMLQKMFHEFHQINKDKIDEYLDHYSLAKKLLNIQEYMYFPGMSCEDYIDSDQLDVSEILYFCHNYPKSPFIEGEVNETKIRNWIKNGELKGERRGKYYARKKDVIDFLVRMPIEK